MKVSARTGAMGLQRRGRPLWARSVAPGGQRSQTTGRGLAGLAALAAVVAVALGACGSGSSPPHVADLGTGIGSASSRGPGASSVTTLPTGNPAQLLDDWARCMRTHGDPNQVDPTIDANKVIEITPPAGYSHGLHGLIAGNSCAVYLTAASTALNGGTPLQTPDPAQEVKFAECMRANGIPDYPDPSAGNGAIHATPGSDLDPNNPTLQNGSRVCDKQDPGVSKFGDTPEPGSIDANIGGQPKGAPGGNGGSDANSGAVNPG
jgi:hypothetical protein